jgi:putative heme-binding domain-containing protein
MQYLFNLRNVRAGWTLSQREAYFHALARAGQKQGARDYYTVLKRVRDDLLASLPRDLASTLSKIESDPRIGRAVKGGSQSLTQTLPTLKFVKEWRIDDFDLKQRLRNRSLENGREAFRAAQCVVCHRFGNEGGLIGPDLTSTASRFDRRAILESIIEPSKVIDEKYRNVSFTLKDGHNISGSVEREDELKVLVREGPFAKQPTELLKEKIAGREPSLISPMPSGLIDVLQRDQILDLLAYLESGAEPNPTLTNPTLTKP